MITIYGIKTCNSVRKAIKFCKDNELEHNFVDFRANPLEDSKVKYFATKAPIDVLFNNRGTKYKDLKLKELNLDDDGKLEWLCKENMLLKRPVVEFEDDLLVGFNEDSYKENLLK